MQKIDGVERTAAGLTCFEAAGRITREYDTRAMELGQLGQRGDCVNGSQLLLLRITVGAVNERGDDFHLRAFGQRFGYLAREERDVRYHAAARSAAGRPNDDHARKQLSLGRVLI